MLRAYQGIFKIMEFPVILGSSDSPTCIGGFEVLNKLENVNGIFNATFPKWLGIYRVNGYENGIHSVLNNTLWTEHSAGSVIVAPEQMEKLFKWVHIGTPVIINL
jgi:hypothetical protein